MKSFSVLLYDIFTRLYSSGIRLAALWNPKAKQRVAGGKDIFRRLRGWRQSLPADAEIVWLHCASLGEFEQGRPLIEAIKIEKPRTIIFISFFLRRVMRSGKTMRARRQFSIYRRIIARTRKSFSISCNLRLYCG